MTENFVKTKRVKMPVTLTAHFMSSEGLPAPRAMLLQESIEVTIRANEKEIAIYRIFATTSVLDVGSYKEKSTDDIATDLRVWLKREFASSDTPDVDDFADDIWETLIELRRKLSDKPLNG